MASYIKKMHKEQQKLDFWYDFFMFFGHLEYCENNSNEYTTARVEDWVLDILKIHRRFIFIDGMLCIMEK